MPLYVVVAPNEQGVGIPLRYMLYTNDAGSHQEQLALEMTLKFIFERMEGVRPNALVIDKCWVEYIALKNVITTYHIVGRWWMVEGNKQLAKYCFGGSMWRRLGLTIYCQKLMAWKETNYIIACASSWIVIKRKNLIMYMLKLWKITKTRNKFAFT